MPLIDPEDYPTTPRGYRHPPDDVGGVNVANDVPGDVTRLAEDIDADVTAHEADTTNVHGIADTSALVLGTRTVSAGAGLSGGGNLSTDRTLSVATGGVTDAMLAGSITPSKVTGTALVASSVDAKGDLLAATGADTVGRLPVGADGEVLVADSGQASGIGWKSLAEADVARASQVGNLLTANQASFEDGTLEGWTQTGISGGGNTTTTSVASQDVARIGSWCMKGTVALEASTARTFMSTYWSRMDTPVQPNEWYTASIYAMTDAASLAGTWEGLTYVTIQFYNSAGTFLYSVAGTRTIINDSDWTELTCSAIAPADAAYAGMTMQSLGSPTPVGVNVYFDCASIHRGVGGQWALPGVSPVGQLAVKPLVELASGTKLSPANPVTRVTGGTTSLYVPEVSASSGVKFTIINDGTGTVTVYRTGSDTIAGTTSVAIPGKGQIEVICDGTQWLVLSGRYTTNSVGLASYEWNHADNAWRLVAYDTGWRDVSSLLVNGWAAAVTDGRVEVRRTLLHLSAYVYLDGRSQTSNTVLTLPSGFRPQRNTYGLVGTEGLSAVGLGAYLSSGGVFAAYSAAASCYYAFTVGASTTLPTSLPGTQITAPA